MKLPRNPKRVCSRIGLALFLFAVIYLGGSVVISVVILARWPGIMQNMLVFWVINDTPLYLIALPVFLLVLKGVPEAPAEERTPMKMTAGKYLLLLVFCLGTTYLLSMVTSGLSALADMAKNRASQTDSLTEVVAGGGTLINFIFVACIPALGEEFIFRYMLKRKLNGAGDAVYMVVSGLTFGLFHMNILQFYFAFALGMALAWVYAQTGKFWIPVSLHFAVNFTNGVAIPAIAENQAASMAVGAGIFVLMAAALVIFFVCRKRVLAGLARPFEAGWAPQWGQTLAQLVYGHPQAAGPLAYAPYAGMPQAGAPAVYPAAYAPVNAESLPMAPAGSWPAAAPVALYAPPRKKQKTVAGLCFLNVGMLLYLVLTGLITVISAAM
ncbi:MAG: lysostaphin resistance A-like protein [Oscillospiraceae bacterium]